MRGMQLVRPGAFAKTHDTVGSVLRNTSCSHGWLRLVVQTIFATIIVTSFVLIVYMAVQKPGGGKPMPGSTSRCQTKNCRVSCMKTPFYGYYDLEIIRAVSDVDPSCTRISLSLNKPTFPNGSIPINWLSGLRAHIFEVVITGGNLMHIPPDAFMSQYSGSINVLVFQNIIIKTWVADSLVGLSNLKQIYIKDCVIENMHPEALRAVDDTLDSLTITDSGEWNPTNVTGSNNMVVLTTVDFSANYFHDVLTRDTFTGIENCRVLYLNSCRLTAIGSGTFDHLLHIEMLFLNNNFLVVIPAGLFSNIATLVDPRPRINLQDNSWYCDCNSEDIKLLVSNDLLLVDPVCHYPNHYQGKTFSEFQSFCKQSFKVQDVSLASVDMLVNNSELVHVNSNCCNNSTSQSTLKMISPISNNRCTTQMMTAKDIHSIHASEDQESHERNWLRFTFFLKTERYSVVQIAASSTSDQGIMWYESSCPNEIYCLDTTPNFLRVYNVDLSAKYVFCPISLNIGRVESGKCVFYNLSPVDVLVTYSRFQIVLYILTVVVCLMFGALSVYGLIRKNPTLIKGSKRVLIVKHKNVDALVLPPKVPVRNDLNNDPKPQCKDDKIFIVPGNHLKPSFNRQKSTRSNKSYAPSYVSAMQPSEDQLAEWRIQHHFNDISITTTSSELSSYSCFNKDPSYYSIEDDITYESLK